MMGLLDKMKNLFGNSKKDTTPQKQLPKDTFRCFKFYEKKFHFVTNELVHAIQLKRALKKINKINYEIIENNILSKEYSFTYSNLPVDNVINVYDYDFKNIIPTDSYVFVEFNKKDLNKIVEEMKDKKWNLIGFSSSKSIYDGKGGNVFRLFLKSVNKMDDVNEMELMQKMKSGKMNFQDLLFVFNQFKSIQGLPIPGLKITPEIILLIKSLTVAIQAMNKREKIRCVISSKRKEKIIKNGIKEETIDKLLQMIKMLRDKSGDFSSFLSNPQKMMDMIEKK